MKRNNAIISLYFVSIFTLILFFPYPKTSNDRITLISSGNVQLTKSNGKSLKMDYRLSEEDEFAFVNFKSDKLDTLNFKQSGTWLGIENEKFYLNQKTSVVYKPVNNNIPQASAFARRFVNDRIEWEYTTVLSQKHTIPVVSIFIDPHELFDFYDGIFISGLDNLLQNKNASYLPWWKVDANWNRKDKSSEKPIHFQFLDPDGKMLFQSKASLKVRGNASRGFAQKSIVIKSQKANEESSFSYSFFGDEGESKYTSLVLRNSGNDWGRTMCSDGYIQSLFNDTLIEKQNYIPVVLYLNGVYWGIYSFMEQLNDDFVKMKYKAKKKQIAIIDGYILEKGEESDKKEYLSVMDFCAKNDLNKESAYEYLCTVMDIDNLARYAAIEIYSANTDWPNLNVRVMRIKDSKKNKWFYVLKDMDCSYSYSGNEMHEFDMFAVLKSKKDPFSVIFNALMKTKVFRKKLANELNRLMNDEFKVQNQLANYRKLVKQLENEMTHQINRWQFPQSLNKWKYNVSNFEVFIMKRKFYILQQIEKYLK